MRFQALPRLARLALVLLLLFNLTMGVLAQEATSQTPPENPEARARQLFTEGEALRNKATKESRQQALRKYEAALGLWRATANTREEANTLVTMGRIYNVLGDKQKALDTFNQALGIAQAGKHIAEEAQALTNIGRIYYGFGDQYKAVEYHQKARELIKNTNNPAVEAAVLNNLGVSLDILGEKAQSIQCYEAALPLWRAVQDKSGEGITLSSLGTAFANSNESQKALDFLYQGLKLSRDLNETDGISNKLNNLGIVYLHIGEHKKALGYFREALSFAQVSGNAAGKATTLNNIGSVFRQLHETETALDFFQQALQLARLVKDTSLEASILTGIGVLHFDANHLQSALDSFNQAKIILETTKKPLAEVTVLTNIGFLYKELNEYRKAEECFTQVLPVEHKISDKQGKAKTLYYFACLERDQQKYQSALTKIEEAIKLIEFIRSQVVSQELRTSYFATVRKYYDVYIDVLMHLHEAEPTAGYATRALQASEQARARSLLELITESRADIRQGVETSLLEREKSLQQRLEAKAEILTKLKAGNNQTPFAVALEKEFGTLTTELEQVRSEIRQKSPRYAALTQPQALTVQQIQTQLLNSETALVEYAFGETRSYLWVVTDKEVTTYVLPKGKELDDKARAVYDLLVQRKPVRSNEKSASPPQTEAAYWKEAAELSQMILAPAAEKLAGKRLLVVPDGALQFIPFGALPQPQGPGFRVQGSGFEKQGSGAQKAQSSVLSPQSFASNPLLVEHEIITLPSATTLAVQRKELANRPEAEKLLAVLADPVFQAEDKRLLAKGLAPRKPETPPASQAEATPILTPPVQTATREVTLGGTTTTTAKAALETAEPVLVIPRLEYSRREAEAILALAPKAKTKEALDFAANRTLALSPELSRYQIVHFATHGLLNGTHPELSGILLSMVDETGKTQDGFVRTMDVFNLNLPAELVVLSACQTGLGKEVRGEGLVGLTRGFMYAGAKRVVVSLWSVNDRATSELMTIFYRKMLKERLCPAAALRAAQLELRTDKRWSDPLFWAPFVIQGEFN